MCNIYVQVHNRGIKPTVQGVSIKLFYANMLDSGKYPDLSKDFWTSFSPKEESLWKPIAPTRNLPEGQKTLTNTPTIMAWQWYVPKEIGSKACLLLIIESAEDPISEDIKKITDVEKLVRTDRHVGLKSLNITN